MTINDPIADMLTRIRNGQAVGKKTVNCPASSMRQQLLSVLKKEGYIEDYTLDSHSDAKKPLLLIQLRYHRGQAVIRELKRISKPGCRVYAKIKDLQTVYHGLGISILSTSKGILSDQEARKLGIGGEILCQVF